MISPNQLKGTGVALVTPFTANKKVDYPALERLVNHVIEGGVDFLVALGTTAETATLNEEEKEVVVKTIIKVTNDRVPIVLGIGGNNTQSIIETIRHSNLEGISAILSVTPYYNKPNQEGLYQHYKAVAEASPLPIILYNVPVRTGVNLEAETCLKLANSFSNIIAVKEASGDLAQIMDIISKKPEEFIVLSGDDALTLPLVSLGGHGVISVIANAYPAEFSEMVNLCNDNRFEEARHLHYKLNDILKTVFKEGNPTGIKALLQLHEIIENQLRLPLVPLSDETFEELKVQSGTF